jgi:hypothetical protein
LEALEGNNINNTPPIIKGVDGTPRAGSVNAMLLHR